MNPDDYDDDGNNIVPCPICLSIYCIGKTYGTCPEEEDFVMSLDLNKKIAQIELEIIDDIPSGGRFFQRLRNRAVGLYLSRNYPQLDQLTDHHFRIDKFNYWTSGKYFDQKTGKRGEMSLVEFLGKIIYENNRTNNQ